MEGKVGIQVSAILQKLMCSVEVSVPLHFYYPKFRDFFKVILTKHGQNESNLPCQNAPKLTYGNVRIKKFSGGYTPGPRLRGGEGR